jgi:hypothetical protein
MDKQRSGATMKRNVIKVNVGQYYDQQHDRNQAAEQEKRRRFDLPARHNRFVLPDFRAEVNPSVVPPSSKCSGCKKLDACRG